MDKFLSFLKNKKAVCGEQPEAEDFIVAQKLLVNMGLDFIPNSYLDFLKHCNGAKSSGAYLFGASIDDELDIVDKNLQMFKPFGTILLGCNDFDLLVYNYQKKEYQIVDREDMSVLDGYPEDNLENALMEIFNV
jgi:hypothetical protein